MPAGYSRSPRSILGRPDDEVGLLRVGELHPAVLGGDAGDLDQRRFDPLSDLRLLLVAAALEPVDVDEGHQARAGSSSASRRRFGIAPTTFFAIAPSLKRSRVGIERTSYWAAVCWFSSTLRLRMVRSSRSASISSSTGWTTRHGPHQGAQKSTRTGPSASRTSDLKVPSVTSWSLPVTRFSLLRVEVRRSILQKV